MVFGVAKKYKIDIYNIENAIYGYYYELVYLIGIEEALYEGLYCPMVCPWLAYREGSEDLVLLDPSDRDPGVAFSKISVNVFHVNHHPAECDSLHTSISVLKKNSEDHVAL